MSEDPDFHLKYEDLTFLEKSKCWKLGSPQRADLERKAIEAGEIKETDLPPQ